MIVKLWIQLKWILYNNYGSNMVKNVFIIYYIKMVVVKHPDKYVFKGFEKSHLTSNKYNAILENTDNDLIKKIPFGTDEYGQGRNEKARLLYRAWNIQKAGRARYAEAKFKQGTMPLKEEN